MIGRKLFSKADNSNSGTDVGILGDAIISSNVPPDTPVSTLPTPPTSPTPATNYTAISTPIDNSNQLTSPKTPKKISPIVIAIISILSTALVCVAIYFIFLAPKPTKDIIVSDITYASPDNDGTQTIEETIAEFDKQISAAANDEIGLGLTLNKVGYYMLVEDYTSALETLNTIDISKLNDFDQYRVYNHYASTYEGLGNSAKAAEYRKLADDANTRNMQELDMNEK